VLAGARGAVVVPEDETVFAGAVSGLLADPGRRAALSELAVADARRWSSRAMAERLVALYLGVIASRQARGTPGTALPTREPAPGARSRVA
jgi:glycosyltransferase involved in cell wall biosynthesis